MKLNWNFLGGVGVQNKNLPWGEYGYFLELHNRHYYGHHHYHHSKLFMPFCFHSLKFNTYVVLLLLHCKPEKALQELFLELFLCLQ